MINLLKKLYIFLSFSQKLKFFTLLVDLFIQLLSLLNIFMIFPLLNFIINFNNSQINVNFFSLLNYLNLFSLKKLLITIFLYLSSKKYWLLFPKIKLKFQIEIITDLTQVISKILLNLNKIKLESTLRILDGEIKFVINLLNQCFCF